MELSTLKLSIITYGQTYCILPAFVLHTLSISHSREGNRRIQRDPNVR